MLGIILSMNRSLLLFPCLLLCICLGACSPEMNWRDVRPVATGLRGLMPCKPEEAVRSVPLDGRLVDMHLTGCDAGGASFVIGWAAAPAERLGALMGEWQDSTLSRAGIASGPDAPNGRPFFVTGGKSLPQAVRLHAIGRSPDGKALPLDAAWFASPGTRLPDIPPTVFFAAIYGVPADPEAAGNFFSNLQLRQGGEPPP
jgi:hypothetical protein